MARGLTDAEAAKLVALGMSDRARNIDTHVRFVDGSIYDGRPAFDDDESGAPLSERRPCVIYSGVENAIESYGDMVFGDEGFPRVTSAPSEDDKEFEDEEGLDEDDSATLDHVVGKIVDQTRFRLLGRQLMSKGMGAGTVAVLLSLRAGRLRVSTIDAATCEAEFDDDDPNVVTVLTISYRYVEKFRDAQDGNRLKSRVLQYRRVIDAKNDTTYKPVEVWSEQSFPTPTAVKEKYAHGFGFCPVRWYERQRDESESSQRDGHPVHEGHLSLIDAVNQSLSQRHRAALYCGDPQIVEIGVEDDEVRVPMARGAGGVPDRSTDASGWGMSLDGKRISGTRSAKRKKGAGSVWRYASENAKVEYLALSGDALKVLKDDADDNIAKLREALSIVHIDPDKLTGSGNVSGKTLAFVCKQQIAACNAEREDIWTGCLLPVLSMLLRIVLKVKTGLYLPGADKARPILERFERTVEGAAGNVAWFDPPLRPVWPQYFEPSDADNKAKVDTVVAASDKGHITDETAAGHLRGVFKDIKDPVAYAAEARKQRDKKADDALARQQKAAPADGPPKPGEKKDDAPAAKKPAKKDPDKESRPS